MKELGRYDFTRGQVSPSRCWPARSHGKHPPLIDKALFDRAQTVAAQRNDTRATSHRFPYTGLLRCAACGCAITAEIKKDRYVYYHCTFDKGSCGGQYVREEELERQFENILGELQFSEALLDWMREALRQSQKEKAAFHRRAIEKLNAQYSKLQNRIDQIYLDKLDGEIEEAFYRRNVSQWREEQAQIRTRIERHEKADQNYIEQGIRLLEVARGAQEFYRTHGQAERADLMSFILAGSALEDDQVTPSFKPPFDIIHRIAQETKKAASDLPTACPVLLPRPDSNGQLRAQLGSTSRRSRRLSASHRLDLGIRRENSCVGHDRQSTILHSWLWPSEGEGRHDAIMGPLRAIDALGTETIS